MLGGGGVGGGGMTYVNEDEYSQLCASLLAIALEPDRHAPKLLPCASLWLSTVFVFNACCHISTLFMHLSSGVLLTLLIRLSCSKRKFNSSSCKDFPLNHMIAYFSCRPWKALRPSAQNFKEQIQSSKPKQWRIIVIPLLGMGGTRESVMGMWAPFSAFLGVLGADCRCWSTEHLRGIRDVMTAIRQRNAPPSSSTTTVSDPHALYCHWKFLGRWTS